MTRDVFGIVGTTVADIFQVEAVVAEGGFAVVYRAQHSVFRAPVALKCLKIPEHLTDAEQARFERQFEAEAELMFKLSAGIGAIVRPLHVEAVLTAHGRFMPFLALEWLDGETLDDAISRRASSGQAPFSLLEVMELLTPVARALESAHDFRGDDGPLSIVHRDVKPENVFIARSHNARAVKLLDFGIATVKRLATQVTTGATREKDTTSFSPAYGAPEQWLPERFGPTGSWTDVWGLALTVVEALAGHPVVDGDRAAMMGTVLDPARRPTPRAEGVSVGDVVEAVFRKALAVNPQARYRHAGEFWDALETAFLAEERRIQTLAPPARRLVRSDRHRIVSTGGAAPVLRRYDALPDLDGPLGARLELDFDDHPLSRPPASGHFAAPKRDPESGEWSRLAPSAPDMPDVPDGGHQWSAHPERASARAAASSHPPGSGARQKRAGAPVASSDESELALRADSRRPPSSGEASLPMSAPANGDRRWRERASSAAVAIPRVPTRTESMPLRELGVLVRLPAISMALGIVLTLLNGAYADASGHGITLGPVRLAWVAAACVLGGIALAVQRLWSRLN
jgi:serine/threonine-protein kinase